jgi:D-psicose/D-tagatose/L-ribulose 3-epimerase
MRFGINTFLFCAPFTNASVRLFPKFRRWGFETVELPMDRSTPLDSAMIKDHLDRCGLVCGSMTPCLGPEEDLRGTMAQQRRGLASMKRVLRFMKEIGAPTLTGVVYSVVGRVGGASASERRRQWRTVVGNLRALAEFAGENGRSIALEPINRFETDFINTCEQGLDMIADVGNPALRLHLDTFHMNIEEKDPAAAIRKAGAHLGHFHACGCDRGTPGSDHIDWKEINAALKAIAYGGDVVIESFSAEAPALAKAASIWRPLAPTRDEIAWKGLQFLKETLG